MCRFEHVRVFAWAYQSGMPRTAAGGGGCGKFVRNLNGSWRAECGSGIDSRGG